MKCPFQLDGACGHVHRVVDECEHALLENAAVLFRRGQHLHLAAVHVLLDVVQLRLRHRECDVDGRQLIDGDQIDVVGLDDVALLHHQVSGAAVDRRADGGIAELDLGLLHGRFIGLDGGLRALNGGLIRLHCLVRGVGIGGVLLALVLGNDALLEQVLIAGGLRLRVFMRRDVAAQVGLGLAQLGGVAGQVGLRLADHGVERPPVDAEQQIALFDGVAFLEMYA